MTVWAIKQGTCVNNVAYEMAKKTSRKIFFPAKTVKKEIFLILPHFCFFCH
jgi:hypothetical protein